MISRFIQRLLLAAVLAGTCLVARPVMAQNSTPSGNVGQPAVRAAQHGKAAMMGIWKRLDLTKAQRTALRPIMKQQRTQAKAIRTNASLTPKEKRVQLRELHMQTMKSVMQVLTPQQRAKLHHMMMQRRKMHAHK